MGFYSTSTPAEKRVQKLTGDININDTFKNECKARGIAIYNAYNIQKRLIHEVEQEMLIGVEAVDDRLMELLDERSKKEVTHRYTDLISKDDKPNLIPKGPQVNIPSKRKPPKPLPKKSLDEIKIPPRSRDGKTFNLSKSNDETVEDLLKKIITQNQKMINQNTIIINELKKLGEKND